MEMGDNIYWDGVNIAARLENLAEGEGIHISKTIFDQIGKNLLPGYKYLGEQTVKNIFSFHEIKQLCFLKRKG
jgi:adenylate cyclase